MVALSSPDKTNEELAELLRRSRELVKQSREAQQVADDLSATIKRLLQRDADVVRTLDGGGARRSLKGPR